MSFIGPALPPHLLKNSDDSDHKEAANSNDSKQRNSPEAHRDKSSDDELYGPALPPGLQKSSTIGPALPPGLRERLSMCDVEGPDASDEGSESEDPLVGPMPQEGESSYAARLIEERSLRMHQKLMDRSGKDVPKKREEWMLELPEGRTRQAMLGMNLAPRTFQTRPAPKLDAAGRSAWTDTPADKERKLEAQRRGVKEGEDDDEDDDDDDYLEREAVMQRDMTMEKITEEHNSSRKRKESLLDMHLKKQKKEAKKKRKKEKKKRKESGHSKREERRPFDRDVDLQANRFDQAQKAAILKKAQLLDDRFSRGKQKFL